MEIHLKVSSRRESQKKAKGATIWQSRHQKISNFLHARHRAINTKLLHTVVYMETQEITDIVTSNKWQPLTTQRLKVIRGIA